MRTPAQIAGHPIHPMLVSIPIGLWIFSFVCDLIARASSEPATWTTCALYAMVGGIIGALAAAVPGVIDMLSLRDKPIKRTAITHMAINLIVVGLYVANAVLRSTEGISHGAATGLSLLSIGLLSISGWLGGKMVYVAGVAVHTEEGEAATSAGWHSRTRQGRGAAGMGRPNPDRAMASDRPGRETDRS